MEPTSTADWYSVDLTKLTNRELSEKFVQFDCDEETNEFLANCEEKSKWMFTNIRNQLAKGLLSKFMTITSINGYLNRGKMFVISKSQLTKLIPELNSPESLTHQVNSTVSEENSPHGEKRLLLDLGAGDGNVTDKLSVFFTETHCTEISPVMQKILARKQFKLLNCSSWHQQPDLKYDLIACLNLLDRCDQPITILQQMKSKLKPTGLILMALVLPFNQFVEESVNNRPSESIEITGLTFEEQLCSLDEKLFAPNGLKIVKWSKVPYLCEGDLDETFYRLTDSIIVLKPV